MKLKPTLLDSIASRLSEMLAVISTKYSDIIEIFAFIDVERAMKGIMASDIHATSLEIPTAVVPCTRRFATLRKNTFYKSIGILPLIFVLAGCVSHIPTWQEQYDLGMQYLSEEKYEETVAAFSAAIEIEPNNADAYLGRAQAYAATENYEKALADYDTITEIEPARDEAYEGMARIYIKAEDLENAFETIEKISDEEIRNELFAEIDKQEEVLLPTVYEMEVAEKKVEFYCENADSEEDIVGELRLYLHLADSDKVEKMYCYTSGADISEWTQKEIARLTTKINNRPLFSDMLDGMCALRVREDDLGKTWNLLIIGVGEEFEPIGYTIAKVQIPTKEESEMVQVVDAENYSRPVNPNIYGGDGLTQKVVIPRIVGKSNAVNMLNLEMYENFSWILEELKAGNIGTDFDGNTPALDGDHMYYEVDYDYSVNGSVVGIVQTCAWGAIPGGGNLFSYVYYYDAKKDAEIDVSEYLDGHGIDIRRLNELVASSEELEYEAGPYAVKYAIVYENEVLVVLDHSFGLNVDSLTIDRSKI